MEKQLSRLISRDEVRLLPQVMTRRAGLKGADLSIKLWWTEKYLLFFLTIPEMT